MIQHVRIRRFAQPAAAIGCAGLCGRGIDHDPGGDISRLASEAADDADHAAQTAQQLAKDRSQVRDTIERERNSWKDGTHFIGK